MSFFGSLSAAILALAIAAASRGHDAMTIAALVGLAAAFALLAQLERARDCAATSPDVVWVRRAFRLFSRISFEWAAPYNVATLTIRNDGEYPIRVEGLAKIQGCTYRSNPIDPRPFSLGWQEVDTREVTIKPNGVASLILAKVDRTPQPDANPYEWYTLSFPEFGKTDPVMAQLWSRKEELRYALAVEIHCMPPAAREPTRHAISVGIKPPSAKLDIAVGTSALVERLAATSSDDLGVVDSRVIGPIAAAVADDLENEARRSVAAPQGADGDGMKAVRALAQSVTTSPTSPLPHPKKYANAITELDRLHKEANAGNAQAIEDFCVMFENAHKLARDMWGSTGTYYDDFFHRYQPKLEQLVRDTPEDRGEALQRLLDKMTASIDSPLPPEGALRNARVNLDDLFRRGEAGDKRALRRLPLVFEDAQKLAQSLYGDSPRFLDFFVPASERLKKLLQRSEQKPWKPWRSPVLGAVSDIGTAMLVAPLQILPSAEPSVTALGDLYKGGERLLRFLREDGRSPMPLGATILKLPQMTRAWCRLTAAMVERMPETTAPKPFRGSALGDDANVWEATHYVEQELETLRAYLKSL